MKCGNNQHIYLFRKNKIHLNCGCFNIINILVTIIKFLNNAMYENILEFGRKDRYRRCKYKEKQQFDKKSNFFVIIYRN